MSVYTSLTGSLDFDNKDNFEQAINVLTNTGYLRKYNEDDLVTDNEDKHKDNFLYWVDESDTILDECEPVKLNTSHKTSTITFPNIVQRNIGRVFDRILPLSNSNCIREVCLDGMVFIAEYNDSKMIFQLEGRDNVMKFLDFSDEEIIESKRQVEEEGFDEDFEEQLYNWAANA